MKRCQYVICFVFFLVNLLLAKAKYYDWGTLVEQKPWVEQGNPDYISTPGETGKVILKPAAQPLGDPVEVKMTHRGINMDGAESTCQYMKTKHYMDSYDNQYLTGVSGNLWESSLLCGQGLVLEYKGRKAMGVIADLCPDCEYNQIDVNKALAGSIQIDGIPQNIYHGDGLTITPVACDWDDHGIEYYMCKGSDSNKWYIIVLWSSYPLEKIVARFSDGTVSESTHDYYGRYQLKELNGNGKDTAWLELHGIGSDEILYDTIHWSGETNTLLTGTGTHFTIPEKDVSIYLRPKKLPLILDPFLSGYKGEVSIHNLSGALIDKVYLNGSNLNTSLKSSSKVQRNQVYIIRNTEGASQKVRIY